MDTVQPLEEDRALLVHIISGQPAPLTKLVAVAKPLSLYKYFETLWIGYTHTPKHNVQNILASLVPRVACALLIVYSRAPHEGHLC